MSVNKKKQAVVQHYLTNGRNITNAYEAIYGCKRSTAAVNGCKLFKEVDIKEYLELQESKLQEKYNITREKVVEELLGVIDSAKTELEGITDRNSIIKTLDILNKMTGLYAVEKTETQIRFDVDLGDE